MSRRTRSSLKTLSRVKQALETSTAAQPAAASPISIQVFDDLDAWETWLESNHTLTEGNWLKIGKKGCPVPTVAYDEAIDGALCFGWIDGQRKSHDEQFYIQKFTPRRKNSIWSKRNVD